MNAVREKILVVDPTDEGRRLVELLQRAGYEVHAGVAAKAVDMARAHAVDLVLLDADCPNLNCEGVLTTLEGSSATKPIRVILLTSRGAAERAQGFDLGADDVVARPSDSNELLARVRAQLRAKHAEDALRQKARVAEEGQEIAHTAFQALAVTEKMTRDAFTLDRRLKIGVGVFLVVAAAMAVIFVLYSRRAEQETRRAYAVVAQLERGLNSQQELIERSRKMREEMAQLASPDERRQQLEQLSSDLQARLAGAQAGEVAALRDQLSDARTRLRRLENEGRIAERIIRTYAPSVCLVHVVVAFRHQESGRRLRYAGINPDGAPLQDSEGNPAFSLDGRGPEVRADFFGTGFLVSADGRILTNRHVVEPWWKNPDLSGLAQDGLKAEISEVNAYFPDLPRATTMSILDVSAEEDLATARVDLAGVARPALVLESRADAAASGQPVVLLGYPTGLDAILARAGEDAVRQIVAVSGGRPRDVMTELAARKLIRPIATQGHIGDVLADKIVYDAQTTSGGSGGPLFNAEGRVIGVNFAVIRGFGGSNFGIPIRLARPLLSR